MSVEPTGSRAQNQAVTPHQRPPTPSCSSPGNELGTPASTPNGDGAESPITPKDIQASRQSDSRQVSMGEPDEEDDEELPLMDRKSTLDEKAPWRESHRRQAQIYRAKALHFMELDHMTSNTDMMTRRDVFHDIVRKQRKNRHGCLVLPLNIAFFALYAIAARLHEDITNVWLLESSMRHHLEQQLETVNTIDDVWDWLKGDMMSLFFEQHTYFGDPLPETEWSRVLLYSQVQGSVILEQTRENGDSWGIPYPGPGLPNYLVPVQTGNVGFTPKPTSRRLSTMKAQWMSKFLDTGASDGRTYEFPLYPTVQKQQVLGRLEYLEKRRWLDDKTEKVTMIVMLLNGELGRPRLEQVKIELQFSRGGGIFAKVSLQALFLQLFASGRDGLMSMCADTLWTTMLIVSTVICLRNLWVAFVSAYLARHLKQGIVLMELFIMLLGWINVGGVYMQATGISKVAESLEALRKDVIDDDATSVHYVTSAEEDSAKRLHRDANDLISVMENFRTGIAWMTLVLIFRFFTSFRVQPRLAIVTNTLKATIIDLAHFLVVFCPTFFAYAVSGNILFGRRIEQFSTIQGSIGICLRIVFENEYEWLELSEEYFYSTAVWAWSFLIMVVMIMLNMVLAIVLDIYNEVRATTDASETVFRFIWQMALHLRKFKQWIGDRDLECFFDEANDANQSMTVDHLTEALPTMTEEQRAIILGACKSEMLWQARQELVASHFLKLGASIKLSVDDASVGIVDLDKELARQDDIYPESPRLPETPRSARSGPATPRASPKRMVGSSRPFPGIPKTPGGYFPPVCPSQAQDFSVCRLPASRENGDREPRWYQEFLAKIKASGEMMDVVLADLRKLHWQWHQVDVSATRKAYGKASSRKSVCSISDLKIAGGHPIL